MATEDAENEPEPEDYRTEYAEAGQEARYRHQLMQNSYYLILVLNGVFIGALYTPWTQGDWSVMIFGSLFGGFSIAFLAVTLHSNISKRSAAWTRRHAIERDTDHDAFRIQQDTLHRRAQYVKEGGEMKYERVKKNRVERTEAKWIPYIFGLNAVVWFAFVIVSLCRLFA